MPFILTGFTQDIGFRVFAFARGGADRSSAVYTVRADLALSRRYEIALQELPLLCQNLLESREDIEQTCALTFGEEEMCLYATKCAMAREAPTEKGKSSRQIPGGHLGAAWRGHGRTEVAPAETPASTATNSPGPQPNGPLAPSVSND